MSYTPVYVPRNKRKRPVADESTNHVPECTPASQVLSKVQRPEDFMDEQDHNEWGGPTRIRAEFDSQPTAKLQTKTNSEDLLSIRSLNVGDKLLRKLGWRDQTNDGTTSTLTAYLPIPSNVENGNDNNVLKVGSKQLRKIALQQSRVVIPQPWKGRWGLGYESELQVPTRKVGSSQYRVSNVVVHSSGVTEAARDPINTEYEANTLQDFVGTHSTAGFALREDEDDAYDDSMGNEKSFHSTVLGVDSQKRSERNQASLQLEAYEHEESDGENERDSTKTSGGFQDALSSWAMGGNQNALNHSDAGRIEGFVLGSTAATTKPKLYRGPDVPKDWHIQPHQFGPNEHPSILKAIAHATNLSVAKERRGKSMEEALQAAILKRRSVFKGIGEQMKNRFAAAGSTTDESKTKEAPKNSITRTVAQFVPDPLLCKRLGVSSIPKQQPTTAVVVQRRDEVFFKNEVLGAVAEASKKQSAETIATLNDEDPELHDEPQRPALHVYKSIYDPDNDIPDDKDVEHAEGSDHEALDDEATAMTTNPGQNLTTSAIVVAPPLSDHPKDTTDGEQPSDDQSSFEEKRKKRKRDKSSKKAKKRHKKKHKKRYKD